MLATVRHRCRHYLDALLAMADVVVKRKSALERDRSQSLSRLQNLRAESEQAVARSAQELSVARQKLEASEESIRQLTSDLAIATARIPREPNLIVPLDHVDVIRPRPADYLFAHVFERFEAARGAMDVFTAPLLPIMYGPHLGDVPAERRSDEEPYWNNGFFSGDDARLAYAIVAHYRPRVYTEIGSGNSTKFVRKAIRDYGLDTRVVSIDPAPRAEIDSLSDEIVRASVLDVPPGRVAALQAGDVLFIDGSHLAFNGSDIVYLALEVLPQIRDGVLVHIHDIMLPWEYDQEFTRRGYNEQYLVAMLTLFSDQWSVLAPVQYLKSVGAFRHGGVSFWMTRHRKN